MARSASASDQQSCSTDEAAAELAEQCGVAATDTPPRRASEKNARAQIVAEMAISARLSVTGDDGGIPCQRM
jgi:hypothetical protein